MAAVHSMHVYEVRPRKDKRGVDLISDVLPFGRLWYAEPNAISNTIGYAMHRSRSHDAVIPFTMTQATWSRRTSRLSRARAQWRQLSLFSLDHLALSNQTR